MSSDLEFVDIDIYILFLHDGDVFAAIRELQKLKQTRLNYRYIKENPVLPCSIIIETSIDENLVPQVISRHLKRIGYPSHFEIYKPLYI